MSDVPSLAKTLGGRGLYSFEFAPLRELLQNAADAIDARAAVDSDFEIEDGRITVRVLPKDDEGVFRILVEDNGIGMSERTLTGALLDFGFSFWHSGAARAEWPGLQAAFEHPRGRYGIGFFSVFMWSNDVRVSSRRYDQGVLDTSVLEFKDGLGRRPIIRVAEDHERSTKFTTSVSLTLGPKFLDLSGGDPHMLDTGMPDDWIRFRRAARANRTSPDWHAALSLICGALPIEVFLVEGGTQHSASLPNWKNGPVEDFVSLLERLGGAEFSEDKRRFANAMSPVNTDAKQVGRAFIVPEFGSRRGNDSSGRLFVYERGIFVGVRSGAAAGMLEGISRNVARENFSAPALSKNTEWLDQQADYLLRLASNVGEIIACQESLLSFGVYSSDHPLFVHNREIVSLSVLLSRLKGEPEVSIRMSARSMTENDVFNLIAAKELSVVVGKSIDRTRVHSLVGLPGDVSRDDDLSLLGKQKDSSPFQEIFAQIAGAMGENAEITKQFVEVSSYSSEQAMIIRVVRKH